MQLPLLRALLILSQLSHLAAEITGSVLDGFTNLIKTNVNVVVDPLRIIYNNPSKNVLRNRSRANISFEKVNSTLFSQAPTCALSIHRNDCSGPRILRSSKIAWNTRICFKWQCENATKFAMKVENCWTGSIQNPIFIINGNGCTNEETMISSPEYHPLQQTATAIGWLSVRLVGSEYIRLACAIRLCNLCDDPFCSLITPPKCLPSTEHEDNRQFKWHEENLNFVCNPPSTPTSNVLPVEQSNSAIKYIDVLHWLTYSTLQLVVHSTPLIYLKQ